ncbi:MAG: hypothetical protein QXI50_07480 [Candidatus Caldarchaeum sp.]
MTGMLKRLQSSTNSDILTAASLSINPLLKAGFDATKPAGNPDSLPRTVDTALPYEGLSSIQDPLSQTSDTSLDDSSSKNFSGIGRSTGSVKGFCSGVCEEF